MPDLPAEVVGLLQDPTVYLEADQLALDKIRGWAGLDIDRHLWLAAETQTPERTR